MTDYIASHQLLAALGLNPATVRVFEWRDRAGSTYTASTARSHALIGYRVTGGRPDVRSRTTPLTCVVELVRDWCTAPDLGDRFRLTLADTVAAALGLTTDQAVRFTGTVTDVLEVPSRNVIQVAAAGLMVGRLAVDIDLTDLAEQYDGARANTILTAAGYGASERSAAGGRWRMPAGPSSAAADYDPSAGVVNARTYLDQLADSTLAQLVEERTGLARWSTLEHRGDATSAVTLDGSDLLNSFEWRKAVGDVINAATAASGQYGDQTALDPASVTDLDNMIYLAKLPTLHWSAYQAAALAWSIVALFSVQQYRLPALAVDLTRTVSTAQAAALLKVSHGHRLTLAGLPAGPYSTTPAYVEGWAEEARSRSWRMDLYVSDPYLSADALDIDEAPADLAFAGVDPDLTFLAAAHVTTPGGLAA